MIFELFDSQLIIDEEKVDTSERELSRQIEQYLSGEREYFDVIFDFPGAATGHILREVNRIPYGETRTYTEIAEELGTSAIAVGQVCSRNPLPLIIPCHRVTGKENIGGYQAGEDAKRKLLELEQ